MGLFRFQRRQALIPRVLEKRFVVTPCPRNGPRVDRFFLQKRTPRPILVQPKAPFGHQVTRRLDECNFLERLLELITEGRQRLHVYAGRAQFLRSLLGNALATRFMRPRCTGLGVIDDFCGYRLFGCKLGALLRISPLPQFESALECRLQDNDRFLGRAQLLFGFSKCAFGHRSCGCLALLHQASGRNLFIFLRGDRLLDAADLALLKLLVRQGSMASGTRGIEQEVSRGNVGFYRFDPSRGGEDFLL